MRNKIILQITILLSSIAIIFLDYSAYSFYEVNRLNESLFFYIFSAFCQILLTYLLTKVWVKKHKQISLVPTIFEKNHHIINHYFLPLILVLILPIFWIFYGFTIVKILSFIFSIILIFLLFLNLNYFYSNKFKLVVKTHFIYDLLNIYIFFITNIILFNLFFYTDLIFLFKLLVIISVNFLFYILIIYRYFTKIIKKVFNVGLIFLFLLCLELILFDFNIQKGIVFCIGTYINYILCNRKYLLNDYSFSKKVYSELILIQLVVIFFLILF